jgi:hypothetical protein
MVVGVCQIDILIHGSESLKAKRRVLRSLKDNIKNRFNASVAEVGDHDLWQRSLMGIVIVGVEKPVVNSVLDKLLNFLDTISDIEVVSSEVEFINY